MGRAYGRTGVEKGESDMHLYGTKRDRSERVVCCFQLYKLFFLFLCGDMLRRVSEQWRAAQGYRTSSDRAPRRSSKKTNTCKPAT